MIRSQQGAKFSTRGNGRHSKLFGYFENLAASFKGPSTSRRRTQRNEFVFEAMEPRNLLAAVISTPTEIADVGVHEIFRSDTESIGRLFYDANRDAVRQNGEDWLPNWVVFGDNNGNDALDGGESFATTNNGGWYHLQGLMPGSEVTPLLAPGGGIAADVTDEGLVNTDTHRVQIYSDVATHRDGSIIVYNSWRKDGAGWGVFGQRFDADGVKVGPEFQVNTTTKSAQYTPSVAAFPTGEFVVTWMSAHSGNWDIYAQAFDAAGNKVGAETMVNSSPSGNQMHPVVKVLSNDNVLIGWQGQGMVNGQHQQGIWGRIVNSAGSPVSGEIPISMTNFGGFHQFDFAPLPNGGFAAAFEGSGDPDNRGIYVKKFNNIGQAQGPKYLVNQSHRDGRQWQPAIDSNANGDLFVAWTSNHGDGSGKVVYLQQIDAQMILAHGPTRVASEWLGTQWRPDVVAMANGNVAVAWQGRGLNEFDGVYVREFNSQLQPMAGEYRLSDTPKGMDRHVSMDGFGNTIVAAWHGKGDPDNFGVYSRVMKGSGGTVGIVGRNADVIYVIDVSGSTGSQFQGDPVGDRNNDGTPNTILDAEIAAYEELTQALIDATNSGRLNEMPDISVVTYDSSASRLTSPSLKADQDDNMNGVPDVIELLRGLNDGGGTNYEAGLQEAINVFDDVMTTFENGNIIFTSDGFPNSLDFTDEANELRMKAANVRAFGVGSGADLTELQKIDPNAQIFTSSTELLLLFGSI